MDSLGCVSLIEGICRDLASVGPTGLAETQTANALARRLVEVMAGWVQFVDTPGTPCKHAAGRSDIGRQHSRIRRSSLLLHCSSSSSSLSNSSLLGMTSESSDDSTSDNSTASDFDINSNNGEDDVHDDGSNHNDTCGRSSLCDHVGTSSSKGVGGSASRDIKSFTRRHRNRCGGGRGTDATFCRLAAWACRTMALLPEGRKALVASGVVPLLLTQLVAQLNVEAGVAGVTQGLESPMEGADGLGGILPGGGGGGGGDGGAVFLHNTGQPESQHPAHQSPPPPPPWIDDVDLPASKRRRLAISSTASAALSLTLTGVGRTAGGGMEEEATEEASARATDVHPHPHQPLDDGAGQYDQQWQRPARLLLPQQLQLQLLQRLNNPQVTGLLQVLLDLVLDDEAAAVQLHAEGPSGWHGVRAPADDAGGHGGSGGGPLVAAGNWGGSCSAVTESAGADPPCAAAFSQPGHERHQRQEGEKEGLLGFITRAQVAEALPVVREAWKTAHEAAIAAATVTAADCTHDGGGESTAVVRAPHLPPRPLSAAVIRDLAALVMLLLLGSQDETAADTPPGAQSTSRRGKTRASCHLLQPVVWQSLLEEHWETRPLIIPLALPPCPWRSRLPGTGSDAASSTQLPRGTAFQQSPQKATAAAVEQSSLFVACSHIGGGGGRVIDSRCDCEADDCGGSRCGRSSCCYCSLIPLMRTAWLQQLLTASCHCPLMDAAARHVLPYIRQVRRSVLPYMLSRADVDLVRNGSQRFPTSATRAAIIREPLPMHAAANRAADEARPKAVVDGAKEAALEVAVPPAAIVTVADCRTALQCGFTVVLRAAGARSELLCAVQDDLEAVVGLPTGANIYCTPAGNQGLSAHYDDHCVMVLQLQGSKEWLLQPPWRLPNQLLPLSYCPRLPLPSLAAAVANTAPAGTAATPADTFQIAWLQDPGIASDVPPSVATNAVVADATSTAAAAADQDTSPSVAAAVTHVVLQSGDILYVPRGWGHQAVAVAPQPLQQKPHLQQQQAVATAAQAMGASQGVGFATAMLTDPPTTLHRRCRSPLGSHSPMAAAQSALSRRGPGEMERVAGEGLPEGVEGMTTAAALDFGAGDWDGDEVEAAAGGLSLHVTFGLEVEAPFTWMALTHAAVALVAFGREAACSSSSSIGGRRSCGVEAHGRRAVAMEREQEEAQETRQRPEGVSASGVYNVGGATVGDLLAARREGQQVKWEHQQLLASRTTLAAQVLLHSWLVCSAFSAGPSDSPLLVLRKAAPLTALNGLSAHEGPRTQRPSAATHPHHPTASTAAVSAPDAVTVNEHAASVHAPTALTAATTINRSSWPPEPGEVKVEEAEGEPPPAAGAATMAAGALLQHVLWGSNCSSPVSQGNGPENPILSSDGLQASHVAPREMFDSPVTAAAVVRYLLRALQRRWQQQCAGVWEEPAGDRVPAGSEWQPECAEVVVEEGIGASGSAAGSGHNSSWVGRRVALPVGLQCALEELRLQLTAEGVLGLGAGVAEMLDVHRVGLRRESQQDANTVHSGDRVAASTTAAAAAAGTWALGAAGSEDTASDGDAVASASWPAGGGLGVTRRGGRGREEGVEALPGHHQGAPCGPYNVPYWMEWTNRLLAARYQRHGRTSLHGRTSDAAGYASRDKDGAALAAAGYTGPADSGHHMKYGDHVEYSVYLGSGPCDAVTVCREVLEAVTGAAEWDTRSDGGGVGTDPWMSEVWQEAGELLKAAVDSSEVAAESVVLVAADQSDCLRVRQKARHALLVLHT